MRAAVNTLLLASWAIGIAGIARADTTDSAPLRVLLLSGQNNHDWRATTPRIRSLLEGTGWFSIEIDEHPEHLSENKLQSFHVVLSNWNNYGSRSGAQADWSDRTRACYVDFVQNGGGHVVVHAGSSSFPDWKEYQQVSLATWKAGQTTHGRPHTFLVSVEDDDHPITRGLANFPFTGELWLRAGLQPGATVLATGNTSSKHGNQSEPVALAGRFGKGRSFTLLLGHDASEMESEGFQALLTRGVYWAATGEAPRSEATRPLGQDD